MITRPALAGMFAVTVASVLVACGSAGSSGGEVRLVDDTGRPDAADGGGWVAIVPAEGTQDLWDAVGEPPGDDLPHAAVPLTREGDGLVLTWGEGGLGIAQ